MISYNQANQNQKDNFFKLITGIFNLYTREGEQHYRITKSSDAIIVRESTQTPPSISLRKDFRTIMINLKEMGLIEYRSKSLQVGLPNSARFFSSSA